MIYDRRSRIERREIILSEREGKQSEIWRFFFLFQPSESVLNTHSTRRWITRRHKIEFFQPLLEAEILSGTSSRVNSSKCSAPFLSYDDDRLAFMGLLIRYGFYGIEKTGRKENLNFYLCDEICSLYVWERELYELGILSFNLCTVGLHSEATVEVVQQHNSSSVQNEIWF